jgi:hypothetical protein
VNNVERVRAHCNRHSVQNVKQCLVGDNLSRPSVVQFYRAVDSASEYTSIL